MISLDDIFMLNFLKCTHKRQRQYEHKNVTLVFTTECVKLKLKYLFIGNGLLSSTDVKDLRNSIRKDSIHI